MKKKIVLGGLTLDHNVIYAPLAGVSDYPFRKISCLHDPALVFCEMVKMEPVVRQIPETLRMLDYDESMRPIGAQICGSCPILAKEAAKIIEDMGFDLLDLNCGCPVDKVTKKGCGSGMLKEPELIAEVIEAMVSAVKIPVTIKIRAGWDQSCINAPEITKIAEKAGAKAIFVHGRTRQQAYNGPADWSVIADCKRQADTIVVIGNGDVFSQEAACRMIEQTHCDGVLVSRGTMGKPWIAEDILAAFEGKSSPERTLLDQKNMLLKHLSYSYEYKDERKALIDARKLVSWYCRSMHQARQLRKKVMMMQTFQEVKETIIDFDWES